MVGKKSNGRTENREQMGNEDRQDEEPFLLKFLTVWKQKSQQLGEMSTFSLSISLYERRKREVCVQWKKEELCVREKKQ